MKPKRQAKDALEKLTPDTPLQMASTPTVERPRRRPFFKIGALILPVLALVGLELGLRLFDYGYRTEFFLPRRTTAGAVWIENQDFTRQFFPPGLARTPQPLQFAQEKAADTCRIFIFGESAALGDPEPAFGFGRMLQVLLGERFPNRNFEVVNVAITAINSHVVRQIARECATRKGDIWIIYLGNNEVVGPYGGGTVFSRQVPKLWSIRMQTAFKRFRVVQLVDAIRWRVARSKEVPVSWAGMEMFLEQRLGLSDPRLSRVYAHFKTNLTEIIEAGLDSGAQVIVSTVASNLKDCPPFASVHTPGLSPSQLAEWEKQFAQGVAAERATNFAAAQSHYTLAAQIDGQHAELVYRQARCAGGLQRWDEAQRWFSRARDLDALRFRADSRINELIRTTAAAFKARGCRLLDTEQALASRSTNGVAGDEFLFEHVHFNFAGNDRVSRFLAEEIVKTTNASRWKPASEEWATGEVVRQRLGLTGWHEYQVVQELHTRLGMAPFTGQLEHPERFARWEERRKALEAQLQPEAVVNAQAICREAVARTPRDWVLRENFARLLQQSGEAKAAEREWRQVIALMPHYHDAYYHLGNVLDAQGRSAEAQTYFRLALARRPNSLEARNGLGLALANQGRIAEARAEYERALGRNPRFAEARINLGRLLAQEGRPEEAMREYALALAANSNSAAAHINMGKLLSAQGKPTEAAEHYREALRLRPDSAIAHFNLGLTLANQGREEGVQHLAEAVRLQPEFSDARYHLAMQLVKQNRVSDALPHLAAASASRPDWIDARFNYGVALAKSGRFAEAVREFEAVLRLKPRHEQAAQMLAKAKVAAGRP